MHRKVSDLELKHLEAYVKVYELRNFSKAAEEMFLSQPSISAYISLLEKELQVQLIYRSTKEFLPTKSGKLFYGYAKEMLSLRDKSISTLKSFSDSSVGSIGALASSVPAQYLLPEILSAFHESYPNIVFNVEQADTAEVIKGIAVQKREIGFVGAKIENPKCIFQDFMTEKLIMIAPYNESFANLKSNDIARLLRDEYFVMREEGSGTRLEYEAYLKNAGINIEDLKISAYFSDTQSIIQAVANGLGLSIVSELAAKQYIRQKMLTPFYIDELPERHFYIVLKKNYTVSATVSTFIQFIHSYKEKHIEI